MCGLHIFYTLTDENLDSVQSFGTVLAKQRILAYNKKNNIVGMEMAMSQKDNVRKKGSGLYKEPNKKVVWLQMLPLLFVVGIVPLICKQATYSSKITGYAWFQGEDSIVDFFLYYKTQFFIAAMVVMVVMVAIKWIQQGKQVFSFKLFAPLLAYVLLILFSAICSEYQEYVWSHCYEQFESASILMGYALVTYYAYLYVDTEYSVKLFLGTLAGLVLIISLVAVSQMTGHDFWATDLGNYLLLSKVYRENNIPIHFGMENMAYGTLYNPNYLGVFSAMLLPVFVALVFVQAGKYRSIPANAGVQEKKEKRKALFLVAGAFVLSVLLAVTLVASQSKAGILIIAAIACLACLFRWRSFLKRWYIVVPLAVVVVAGVLFVGLKGNNYYLNRLVSAFQLHKTVPELESFVTAEDGVTMNYKGRKLLITLSEDDDYVPMVQENGTALELLETGENIFAFTEEGLNGIFIQTDYYEDSISFGVTAAAMEWGFVKDFNDMKGYHFVNEFARPVDCIDAESWLFEGYEQFATSRGYIWSRTLPLLKNCILLGDGPNTFGVVMPQNEYVAKYQNGFYAQIITKPHNGYLQIAQQSGLLSLVCVLVFFAIYLLQSAKLYWKSDLKKPMERIGFGLCLSVLAYLLMALTNDSMIVVAPIFWGILGVGMAVNRMVKQGV